MESISEIKKIFNKNPIIKKIIIGLAVGGIYNNISRFYNKKPCAIGSNTNMYNKEQALNQSITLDEQVFRENIIKNVSYQLQLNLERDAKSKSLKLKGKIDINIELNMANNEIITANNFKDKLRIDFKGYINRCNLNNIEVFKNKKVSECFYIDLKLFNTKNEYNHVYIEFISSDLSESNTDKFINANENNNKSKISTKLFNNNLLFDDDSYKSIIYNKEFIILNDFNKMFHVFPCIYQDSIKAKTFKFLFNNNINYLENLIISNNIIIEYNKEINQYSPNMECLYNFQLNKFLLFSFCKNSYVKFINNLNINNINIYYHINLTNNIFCNEYNTLYNGEVNNESSEAYSNIAMFNDLTVIINSALKFFNSQFNTPKNNNNLNVSIVILNYKCYFPGSYDGNFPENINLNYFHSNGLIIIDSLFIKNLKSTLDAITLINLLIKLT